MSDERVAIVTGSGKGIGRAIAERLARDGYRVVINYKRDAASAHEALTAVQASAPESIVLQADVATPQGARELIEQTHSHFGRLDVLVNNAGPFLVKPVFDTTIEEWQEIIDGNLSSAFYCIKAALPIMRAQKHGHIINIGSLNAENARGAPTTVAYNVAKTGLVVLSKSVARSEARHGIRCNIINPGFIETYATTDSDKRELPSIIPLGALGKVEDISNLVAYLLSEQANYLTGSVINVHGGLWV
ncbi:MAG: SDR family oxidoreductase [Chloroflexota bacterium]|nr:MAG: SDR family oxidoreductase [Chloroflexota bacterium]